MLEDVWKKEPIAIPKRFVGKVPLYQVIARYVLQSDHERITVDRAFFNCQESTNLSYAGPRLTERVTILEGKLVSVESHITVRIKKVLDPRTKRGHAQLQRILTPPKTPIPTYHNIKQYEKYLR